jgi:hypothetical protein
MGKRLTKVVYQGDTLPPPAAARVVIFRTGFIAFSAGSGTLVAGFASVAGFVAFAFISSSACQDARKSSEETPLAGSRRDSQCREGSFCAYAYAWYVQKT